MFFGGFGGVGAAAGGASGPSRVAKRANENPDEFDRLPTIAMQAIIVPGNATADGVLVEAVAFPWFEVVRLLQKDPDRIHEVGWRKWEEIIAGAYRAQGFAVELTSRSGDGGRDVIATLAGVGSIRILDQVKCYKPGALVSADEVRSMLGTLEAEQNASKGIVTTTSGFAPGIQKDPRLARLMPYRLELKPRSVLLPWLLDVASRGDATRGDPHGSKPG